MSVFHPYFAGAFTQGVTPLLVQNPYSGDLVANTSCIGEEQLEVAILAARGVKNELAVMPGYLKQDILLQIAGELLGQQDEFARLICQESGKPWRYAFAEVERAVQTFRVAAEEARRIPAGHVSLDWTPAGAGKEGWIKYFPVGLVAGISPFNFPLNLAVHKIAPAIAAGCPIILKPSSLTPLSTLALAKIIHETALPKGAVSIVPMNRATGDLLVTDERIALLSFTGSPTVGWDLKKRAGRKRVVLELGGNAGMIVTPSADIETAARKAVAGGFAYSGQVCIHTQRIYVHSDIFSTFAGNFINPVKELKPGDPLDPRTEISVMIDEANALRIEDWVNQAVTGGAKVMCGGKREGSFFQPTVITGSTPAMKVCKEEVFGPVVTLEPYHSYEEAVNLMNQTRFGLQAGVFTRDLTEMDYAFRHLEVGGVMINDTPTFRMDHMPYGGVKDSGLGREGVRYAMMDMLEPKILVKDF